MPRFMTLCFFLCTFVFLLMSTYFLPVRADETVIKSYVPQSALVGQGHLTFLFKNVYEARLYAPKGQWSEALAEGKAIQPFALELIYNMGLKGDAIAKRSIEEMKKQGVSGDEKLSRWLGQMTEIFPDVKNGTHLIGVMAENGVTHFYNGSELIGTVNDPAFGVAFFNIWLSDKTSEPALRQKLLGQL